MAMEGSTRCWLRALAAAAAYPLLVAGANVTAMAGANVTATGDPGRVASFLVIGDWGWDDNAHANVPSRRCQQAIANLMDDTMRSLGDVKFVVNVGDSFYPNGVTSQGDWQWDRKWRNVYSSQLRSVPWYSVYGNHDYYEAGCACGDNPRQDCAQINADANQRDHFYMPDLSWHLELPELDLEVIALDLNDLWADRTCNHVPCREKCKSNLQARASAAVNLFNTRMAESTAKNLVVFTHYPTDYLGRYPDMIPKLSNTPGRNLAYFGGHRHNTDSSSVTPIGPNTNWLVGGGGGWSCDGGQQGFVVTEMMADGTMKSYAKLVDYSICCGYSGAFVP